MKRIYISANKDAAYEWYLNSKNIEAWKKESYPVLYCTCYSDDDENRENELDNFVIHADEIADYLKQDVKVIDWNKINTDEIFQNMKRNGYLNNFM